MDELENRTGLPDHLRVLAEELPRSGWDAHPNFTDLTRFWLDRHLMFRDLSTRLVTGAERRLSGDTDPAGHAGEVSRYAGFLLSQLHGHHQIEDHHYFPQLVGLDARLSRGFDILDADHHALDGHIQALANAANAYLGAFDGDEGKDGAGELHGALTRFAGLLERHLSDEEDIVVPIILKYAPNLH